VSKKAALASALFFALSPYIFLFTTVAYSEGLLLFFVLITWYLFKKGKIALASATAAVATVTRVVGILIIIPMLIEVLKHGKQHKLRNTLLCCLPIAAFFVWLAYGQVTANDWLALIHTTEWHGLYTVHGFFTEILPLKGIQAFSELPYPQWLSTLAIWGTIIITPILVVKALKIDKPLAVYSLAYYVGAIVFGALISMPRFLSILFPLWLTVTAEMSHVGKKSMVCFIAVLAVFFIISVDLWINFLNGKFIA
jgi:Gpi18-like mannosyltransferase